MNKIIVLLAIFLVSCTVSRLPRKSDFENQETEIDCIVGLSSCGDFCCSEEQICRVSAKTSNKYCETK